MKILSNKKYNELILAPLKNCFAQIDDDQLLRENGLLYAENKRLQNIIKEAIEYHNNCIENLNLNKIDDNEKLAYKVAYGIHKRYLEILDKENKE